MYFMDGDAFVIVGSNNGNDYDPAWCHNLRSHPQAVVEVEQKKITVRAEEVHGDEWNRLWQYVASRLPFFEDYRKKTQRSIPIMLLRPEP